MPFVPRSHGSHLKQHRRQSQPIANAGARVAAAPPDVLQRDVSQQLDTPPSLSAFDQAEHLQLGDHHFVFAMGMFVAVLIAYLSRRHIRSSFSRIVHAISVHGPGTASHLVHIHFHTTTTHSYSPLHDADDTPSSPIERSTIDIEASASRHHQHHNLPQARDRHLLREEEPAPPYSHVPSSTTHVRTVPAVDKRNTKALHIKVPPPPSSRHVRENDEASTSYPPRSSSLTPSSSASSLCSGYRSPSVVSDSGSSCGQLSPVVVTPSELGSRQTNTSMLNLASPRVTRWDAFPPPPPITSGTTTGTNNRTGNGFYRPALPSDILGTHSPSATPPPQYTITIHSSGYGNNGYHQQEGGVGIVPDIVLSPVPWLPRESVPKSPPHYLTVPPRKSRSRPSSREKKDKALPAAPTHDEKSWAAKMHEKDVGGSEEKVKKSGMVEKKRHYFTSQVSLMALPTLTHSSIADNLFEIDSPVSMSSPTVRGGGAVSPTTYPRVATSPSPSSSSGSGAKDTVQRASTLPVSASVPRPRVAARPPPPRPILPDDLEAVYPDTPSETEDDSSSTSSSSSSSSSSSTSDKPYGWRNSGVSEKNGDGYGTTTVPGVITRFSAGSVPPYASTQTAYSEKRAWTMNTIMDEKKRQDTDEDEDDDVPLAQGLLKAVRKKKEQIRRFSLNTSVNTSNNDKAKSPVIASKVFKEKLFGRLSALAARAKEALENELDSDDEEKSGGDREWRRRAAAAEEYERRREALLQREREAASAFVIGEED
ncbi:hypothetical protein CPB86DRAFT_778055 [Serendipita vermifera]|nr:hypothetical protein CPB86DRAFT_778055 [Serendipita vermifera]